MKTKTLYPVYSDNIDELFNENRNILIKYLVIFIHQENNAAQRVVHKIKVDINE